MTTKKTRDLVKGDRLLISGKVWDVLKAKSKGKKVRLTVASSHDTFTSDVKASAVYELAPKPGKKAGKGKKPLTGNDGQQLRWATEKEARKRDEALRPHTLPKTKAADADWDGSTDKVEKRVRRQLDAELLAVKPAGSDEYFVPMIGPDTIAAHLLTFHDITTGEPGIQPSLADYQEAQRVHDAEHEAFKAGTGALHVLHWHARVRPAQ